MKHLIPTLLAATLAAAAHAAEDAKVTTHLKDASGKDAGSAAFTAASGMVKMDLKASGLAPGKHGIHIHEKGACDPPDFKSAGAHFNPHGRKHGTQADAGAHAGDLPNLVAEADGSAALTMTLQGVSLARGEKNSLLDADGSALVIHAKEDDEKTDPSGNSGDRVACGIIKATQ